MGRVLLLLGIVGVVACAHAPPSPGRETRRVLALERSFHSFVAVRLHDLEDAEAAISALERLRLDWLDLLADADDERERLFALLRLAELHLDLSARVRRVPYPPGLDDEGRATFDAALSRLALPLEAAGEGMLAQVVARADRMGVDGRFVRRARLYQRLHAEGAALDDDDLSVLRDELLATTFRAPRSLLEAGRIGQRAARR